VHLSLDNSSTEPVYRQISVQIEVLVSRGLLPAGSRIPSIRATAQKLGVSPSTVELAYDDLAAKRIIETRRGSGTYVLGNAETERPPEVAQPARAVQSMDWSKYLIDMEYFHMPPPPHGDGRLIRFLGPIPDPALFPLEKIRQVASTMVWSPQLFFFETADPHGYPPLVEHLEREMALLGVDMTANAVLVTTGFQRGLSLVLDYLVKPGGRVAIESPCYTQLLNMLTAKRIPFVAIPVDDAGLDCEHLQRELQVGRIKAIITIPTYHNPTGICMSLERRRRLLELAELYGIPVIEDDWGRQLRFDGPDHPPLKALDAGGYVIHMGTFSKCFLPGLRVGWITCPTDIAEQLVRVKRGADKSDSVFPQALLHNFIARSHLHRHLRRSVKEYRRRRDALCDVLAEQLPDGCSFHKPEGGFSVWVELPAGLLSLPLQQLARTRGVDFTPGIFMMPDKRDINALRLSFSRLTVEENKRGAILLCQLIRDALANPQLLERAAD
jgi:DNA-binding transcriptional MocR family regulator